ncbi:phospholipid phosphatase 6-like [Gigantopelta aegis]|uniref:phospholipid phosphatase 6-like n=1 Tax=Gigantopelta aegis TaxID=1735272 RepID=UPI001B88CC83|nr:phospholipid phosphatase 6-like [Gigantopelta aegis]
MKSTRMRKTQRKLVSNKKKSGMNAFDMKLNSFLTRLFKLDERLSQDFSLCATPDSRLGYLRPLMKLLEISCHGIPWLLGTVIIFVCVHKPEDVEILVNLFFVLIFDLICVGLVKILVRRERPAINKMDMFATVSIDLFSFPSGHTTRAAMLAWFFTDKIFTSYISSYAVVVWAIAVACSRVLLGRHHVSDVAAGFLMGLLEYYVYLKMWVPREMCLEWLEPYFGHVHL